MTKVIRLTESDLHTMIRECVEECLKEEQLNEGWKNWAMAGALGAASMFGGAQNANAQSYNGNNPYYDCRTHRDSMRVKKILDN